MSTRQEWNPQSLRHSTFGITTHLLDHNSRHVTSLKLLFPISNGPTGKVKEEKAK